MLKIFGIIMLCSAGLFSILSVLFNILISKRRLKQKNHAVDLIDRIRFTITSYSDKEISGVICWNCFSGIKKDEKICPNCEVSLKR